jgi:Transport and Golgi organisation 2
MCTLSVIPRDNGYLLGMNRDERIVRAAGLPPEVREVAGAKVIYPTDGECGTSVSGTSISGTWIGANEHGVALALLNWNDVASKALGTTKNRTRGVLIPALIGSSAKPALRAALADLKLEGILPFRLVGVFPSEKRIGEWRWNSVQMEFVVHPWEARHWFSSSLSDHQAERLRRAACRNAWSEPDAGSAPWLHRLHASHTDASRAFSLCVHRPEVRTLSYSEIECTSAAIHMKHSVGSPCTMPPQTQVEIELVRDIGRSLVSAMNLESPCLST